MIGSPKLCINLVHSLDDQYNNIVLYHIMIHPEPEQPYSTSCGPSGDCLKLELRILQIDVEQDDRPMKRCFIKDR